MKQTHAKRFSRFLLTMSSVFLLSCGEAPTSSTPSATEPEEPSSTSIPSSSSEPIPEVRKISLYRSTSRLFLNDASNSNPYLKTYRHINCEDVPYVDMDEFRNVRRYDPTLGYHNMVRLDDGRYDVTSTYGGHCVFDVNEQTVELTDGDAFYSEIAEGKSGPFMDPCVGYKYLKTDTGKSKFLIKGEKTIYRLQDYHMEIVEQDNHLYVPFSLATHLLVNPMHSSFAYNGKDFYNASLIGQTANVVRAYSNDSGFLWSYQGTADTAAHYSKVAAKDGEAYRFEATVKDMRKQDVKCEAVFLQNGTLTFKTDDLLETVDYKGTWSLNGDIIVAELIPEGMGKTQTQYIDLSAGGYYRQAQRTPSMAKATYYQLCMDFDYQYGLKDMLQISSFDAEFERLGIKQTLMGTDVAAYEDALIRFIASGKMGDAHYTMVSEGFSSLHPGVSMATKYSGVMGERQARYQNGVARVSNARSSGTMANSVLNMQGETAVISFASFTCDYKKEFKGIDYYKVPQDTEDVNAFLTSKMTGHFVEGICYALNEVKKNTAIKNVVFDVGHNTGGYTMFVPFLSAIMTDDPMIIFDNSITRSRVEAHYKADLNADGVYGDQGDTWKTQYKYFIIQAGGSFSAGNIFPTAARNGGYATTIGEATAGGGCGVTRRCDLTGLFFQYNGPIGFPYKKADGTFASSEEGTVPVVEMDINDVYNLTKLDNKIKQLNQQN